MTIMATVGVVVTATVAVVAPMTAMIAVMAMVPVVSVVVMPVRIPVGVSIDRRAMGWSHDHRRRIMAVRRGVVFDNHSRQSR